jgi:hypothetical protein
MTRHEEKKGEKEQRTEDKIRIKGGGEERRRRGEGRREENKGRKQN